MIGNLRTGSYGRKITFIHPKSLNGVLTELCEAVPNNEEGDEFLSIESLDLSSMLSGEFCCMITTNSIILQEVIPSRTFYVRIPS